MKTCLLIALLISMPCLAQDEVQPVAGVDSPAEASAEPTQPAADGSESTAPAKEEDGPAIPVSYDASRYESAWEKNPFLLKVVASAQPTIDWAADWSLAGMYSHKGKIRVSIRNKQTNEFKRISNEPKEGDEFTLVKANFNRSRREASAEISKGAQVATLKYDENMAPVTVNNTVRPSGQGQAPGGAAGVINNPAINRNGLPPITRPNQPTTNGRVFNAPNMPGGVSAGQAGMVNGSMPVTGGSPLVQPGAVGQPGTVVQPGIVNPTLPSGVNGAPGAATPPTISRRRQLIPAPVVNPQNTNP